MSRAGCHVHDAVAPKKGVQGYLLREGYLLRALSKYPLSRVTQRGACREKIKDQAILLHASWTINRVIQTFEKATGRTKGNSKKLKRDGVWAIQTDCGLPRPGMYTIDQVKHLSRMREAQIIGADPGK